MVLYLTVLENIKLTGIIANLEDTLYKSARRSLILEGF